LKEKERKEALYIRSFKVKAHPLLRKLRNGEYYMMKSPIIDEEMEELKNLMHKFDEEGINEGGKRKT